MSPCCLVKRASSFTLRVEALWRQRQGVSPKTWYPRTVVSVFITQTTTASLFIADGPRRYWGTADWMLVISSTNRKHRGEFQRMPMWVTPPPLHPTVLQKTGCGIQMQKWSVRSTDDAQLEWSMPNCTLRFSGKFKHEGYCPRLTRTALTSTEQGAGRLSYLQANLAKN